MDRTQGVAILNEKNVLHHNVVHAGFVLHDPAKCPEEKSPDSSRSCPKKAFVRILWGSIRIARGLLYPSSSPRATHVSRFYFVISGTGLYVRVLFTDLRDICTGLISRFTGLISVELTTENSARLTTKEKIKYRIIKRAESLRLED